MSVKSTKKKSHTDWERLETLKDEDIDFSDILPLNDTFFKNAKLRLPRPKTTITMRVDPDVLDWFKKKGKGYQTRINAVLRMYIESHSQKSKP